MEELGRYAARINPLADWENVTMEALTALGRTDEAVRLYEDTVEMYFQEEGLRPSERLLEMLENMGTLIEHQYALLDTIQKNLKVTVDVIELLEAMRKEAGILFTGE